jgi:hypothetical protein
MNETPCKKQKPLLIVRAGFVNYDPLFTISFKKNLIIPEAHLKSTCLKRLNYYKYDKNIPKNRAPCAGRQF